jgi:REP element-mobilizing transposase RayT
MIELLPGNFYHIYNRSISGALLFYREENYGYFLKKLEQYLSNYISVYSYCLLPNHFHLLVSIKEDDQLSNVSKAFSNFFNCYSKSINKQEIRHGALFDKPFKRKAIADENYLKILVNYIHRNPIHHKMCDDVSFYNWSSYNSIVNQTRNFLEIDSVINWFGDINTFVEYVKKSIDDYKDLELES